MANRLSKLQPLVYVPAVPTVASQPAYCVSNTFNGTYSGFSLSGGSATDPTQPVVENQALDDFLKSILDKGYSSVNLTSGGFYSPYAPAQITQKVCYPAVAGQVGSPARYDYLDDYAWNAGARSVALIPADGYFRGTLPPSPVGVQVGFCSKSFAKTYPEMWHSLVARRGTFTIVERGAQVFGPTALPASAVIQVQRANGVVSYLVNGDVVYTSLAPSTGKIYAGTVLYSPGDYVDNPSVGKVQVPLMFSAELAGLRSAISDVPDAQFVIAETPALFLNARLDLIEGGTRFIGSLPRMAVAISTGPTLNWVKAELPALGLSTFLAMPEEVPTSFIGLLPPPLLVTQAMVGESLSFSAEIPLAFAAADIVGYNTVDAIAPVRLRLSTLQPYLPSDVADGSDALVSADVHTLETAMLLIALDSLDVSGSADLVIILELAGMDSLELSDSCSIGSLVEMLAMEQVSIISRTSTAKQQALQYAVNYMSGALTTYQNFDFSGFANAGGQSFAWKPDGLYRIGAANDDGELIKTLIDFGATDYADAHLKRMDMAYLGVRTDGQCYLRIYADDGVERVYRFAGDGNQKRATLAKGVSSRFWNVRLELTDASFATIDNLELEVGVSQRRGFSRR